MLQRGHRRGRIEQKCAPKPPQILPRKPLQANGGTDELATPACGRISSHQSPERKKPRIIVGGGAERQIRSEDRHSSNAGSICPVGGRGRSEERRVGKEGRSRWSP